RGGGSRGRHPRRPRVPAARPDPEREGRDDRARPDESDPAQGLDRVLALDHLPWAARVRRAKAQVSRVPRPGSLPEREVLPRGEGPAVGAQDGGGAGRAAGGAGRGGTREESSQSRRPIQIEAKRERGASGRTRPEGAPPQTKLSGRAAAGEVVHGEARGTL